MDELPVHTFYVHQPMTIERTRVSEDDRNHALAVADAKRWMGGSGGVVPKDVVGALLSVLEDAEFHGTAICVKCKDRFRADEMVDWPSCDECGEPYYQDWSAPSEMWNRVVGSEAGMLCATCFLNRLAANPEPPPPSPNPAPPLSQEDRDERRSNC